MARKPIHLEMAGGKASRQRLWEAIRHATGSFTCYQVSRKAQVDDATAHTYLRALELGGFLAGENGKAFSEKKWTLVRDNGLEAPRLTKDGKEVTQGCANEAMWGTLRRMFKVESVDYRQLAAFASTQRTPVSEATAKTYLLTLAAAGYLECVQPAVRGKRATPARYRLKPAMESGNRAPMIQRTKSVFDPNWNKVIWSQTAGGEDEQ